MLVVSVGMNTQFGILKVSFFFYLLLMLSLYLFLFKSATIAAAQERKQTPLQKKLNHLAKRFNN
jgi:hypothetical protein